MNPCCRVSKLYYCYSPQMVYYTSHIPAITEGYQVLNNSTIHFGKKAVWVSSVCFHFYIINKQSHEDIFFFNCFFSDGTGEKVTSGDV